MAKNNVSSLLTSVDELFTTQEEREIAQRETVMDIPLTEISDFPNHPFKVTVDEKMLEMADSVKRYGVLVPTIVRPKQGGGYEMIAGHRRKMASELAERPTLNCIVRDLTDDEAIKNADYILPEDKTAAVIEGSVTIVEMHNERKPEPIPEVPDSPQTGDNSNLLLWFGLMGLSGASLIGITLYSRKRHREEM